MGGSICRGRFQVEVFRFQGKVGALPLSIVRLCCFGTACFRWLSSVRIHKAKHGGEEQTERERKCEREQGYFGFLPSLPPRLTREQQTSEQIVQHLTVL